MKYFPISIFFLLLACTKEANAPRYNSASERTEAMSSFLMAGLEIDFKHDYQVPELSEDVSPNTKLSDVESGLIKKASADQKSMRLEYPSVKEVLENMIKENENGAYTRAIQITSLKYLRRYFLTKISTDSAKEVKFLLGLLVDTRSVDLDILADAYESCKSHLPKEKRKLFFNYIQNLHDQEIQFVNDNTLKYGELYEKADGAEKYKYLVKSKELERRSLACKYTRRLLNLGSRR